MIIIIIIATYKKVRNEYYQKNLLACAQSTQLGTRTRIPTKWLFQESVKNIATI